MKASGLSYSMHSAGTTLGMAISTSSSPLWDTFSVYDSFDLLWTYSMHYSDLICIFNQNILWQKSLKISWGICHVFTYILRLSQRSIGSSMLLELYHLLKLITDNTTEGSWDEVMRVIGQAHSLVHQNGVLRVQTDIRAGTRYLSLQNPNHEPN